jgi:hypothetical protein
LNSKDYIVVYSTSEAVRVKDNGSERRHATRSGCNDGLILNFEICPAACFQEASMFVLHVGILKFLRLPSCLVVSS